MLHDVRESTRIDPFDSGGDPYPETQAYVEVWRKDKGRKEPFLAIRAESKRKRISTVSCMDIRFPECPLQLARRLDLLSLRTHFLIFFFFFSRERILFIILPPVTYPARIVTGRIYRVTFDVKYRSFFALSYFQRYSVAGV